MNSKQPAMNKSPFAPALIIFAMITTTGCPMGDQLTPNQPAAQQINDVSNGCGPASLGSAEEGTAIFALLNCNLAPDGTVYCFTPACDNHDLCYATCHESLNLTRAAHKASCEEAFRQDLNAVCDGAYAIDSVSHFRCRATAFIYYSLVNNFGDSAYTTSQDDACAGNAARSRSPDLEYDKGLPTRWESPFPDQDRDLLPDDWESAVGLDPTDPADAMQDFDGDGLVNLLEYANALDPFHPQTRGPGIDDRQLVTDHQSQGAWR